MTLLLEAHLLRAHQLNVFAQMHTCVARTYGSHHARIVPDEITNVGKLGLSLSQT